MLFEEINRASDAVTTFDALRLLHYIQFYTTTLLYILAVLLNFSYFHLLFSRDVHCRRSCRRIHPTRARLCIRIFKTEERADSFVYVYIHLDRTEVSQFYVYTAGAVLVDAAIDTTETGNNGFVFRKLYSAVELDRDCQR